VKGLIGGKEAGRRRFRAPAAARDDAGIDHGGGNNARSSMIYPCRRVTARRRPLIQGERNETMAEHRRIWPLLVYGGLTAIAAARRGAIERARTSSNHEAARKPRRILYPAPDETGEIRGDAPLTTPVDPDKRPREQLENDQPISAQIRRAKEQGRGRHALAPCGQGGKTSFGASMRA
jgi:hypothetical protein